MATAYFKKLKKEERATLLSMFAFIVTGTRTAGHALVPLTEVEKLRKAEPNFLLVTVESKDAEGNVSAKATEAGLAAFDAQATATAAQPVVPASTTANTESKTDMASIEIFSDIEVPATKRGGIQGETYPFESLKTPGQSFFVPKTEKRPNPAKSLASTVNSATKRYQKADPTVKFVIRPAKHPKTGVEGAMIWRTAITPKPAVTAPAIAAAPPTA